jgi:hypothetical protein
VKPCIENKFDKKALDVLKSGSYLFAAPIDYFFFHIVDFFSPILILYTSLAT